MRKQFLLWLVMLLATVNAVAADYYNYTEANGVVTASLTDGFKAALQANTNYGNWTYGTPLPAPATTYGGKNVTSYKNMFNELDKVTKLDLSNWNTSNVTDMSNMFNSCKSLEELNVSKWNTSKVTSMYYMFNSCTKLTSLDLRNFNTANVTNMYYMFNYCDELTSLNVSSFNTAKVTTMQGMFRLCRSLKSIDLSSFEIGASTDMSIMLFATCNRNNYPIKGIAKDAATAARLNNANVTNIIDELTFVAKSDVVTGNLFYNYYATEDGGMQAALTVGFRNAIDNNRNFSTWTAGSPLPSPQARANGKPVTSYEDLFRGITAETLDLSSFKNPNVTTMQNMLYGCENLTSLDLSSFSTTSVTNMSGMFYNCKKLTTLDLSSFNTENVTDMSQIFSRCETLTSLNLSSFNTSNVTNMYAIFSLCRALEALDLSNFDMSNATNLVATFNECRKLRKLTLGKWKSSNVTDMRQMFYNCRALEALDLSSFSTEKVTDYNSMFYACTNLAVLDLSNFVINGSAITTDMFYETSRNVTSKPAKGIAKDEATATQLNSTGNIVTAYLQFEANEGSPFFYNYTVTTGLSTVVTVSLTDGFKAALNAKENYGTWTYGTPLPAPAATYKGNAVTSYARLFQDLTNVTELDLSEWNTTSVTNMQQMFSGCENLTKVVFSTYVTSNLSYTGSMFANCYKLEALDLSSFDMTNIKAKSGMFTNTCRDAQTKPVQGKARDDAAAQALNTSTGINKEYLVFEQAISYYNYETTYDQDLGIEVIKASLTSDFKRAVRFSQSYGEWEPGTPLPAPATTYEGKNVTSYAGMFSNLHTVKELDLSNFNTSRVKSMNRMFYYCDSLEKLNVSSFNTTSVLDMFLMFGKCKALTTLDLSNFSTKTVTSMRSMFSECENLKTLDLSCFTTESVTNMVGMFSSCYNLTALDLRKWDLSNVEYKGGMFTGTCKDVEKKPVIGMAIDKATAELLNTDSVTDINNEYLVFLYDAPFYEYAVSTSTVRVSLSEPFKYALDNHLSYKTWTYGTPLPAPATTYENQAVTSYVRLFEDCKADQLDLTGRNTDNITAMAQMFIRCTELKSVNLSSFNTSNVNNFRNMFSSCSKLDSLNVSNFNTEKATEMTAMFSVCESLKELDLSNFNTENVTAMDVMFYGCSNLKELNLSNFNTEKVTKMDNMFSGTCANATSKPVKGVAKDYATAEIFNDATKTGINTDNLVFIVTGDFYNYEVTDDGVKVSLTDGFKAALNANKDYADWTYGTPLPAPATTYEGKAVTSMQSLFNNCQTVTKLDLSKWNTENVTDMSYMFRYCHKLESLDISSFNTSNVTNMGFMFGDCDGLKTLDLSNFNTSKVEYMICMFSRCDSLEKVNVSSFDTRNTTNLFEMFSNCHRLKELDLSNFVINKAATVRHMFYLTCQFVDAELKPVKGFAANKATVDLFNNADTTSINSSFLVFELAELPYYTYSETEDGGVRVELTEGFKEALNKNEDYGKWKYGTPLPAPATTYNVSSNDSIQPAPAADGNGKPVTSYYRLFHNVSGATELDLTGWNTENVTNMHEMFYNCLKLTSLNLTSFNTSNVTDMDYMFFACRNLTAIDLSSFNTGNVTTMSYLFADCQKLEHMNLTNWNTENVNYMNGMFLECKALKSVDVTKFNTTKVTSMSQMFYNCYNMEAMNLANFDLTNVTNFSYMFMNTSRDVENKPVQALAKDEVAAKLFNDPYTTAITLENLIFSAQPTGIDDINADETEDDGIMYNLAGQRVGKGYKGIVIKKGQKKLVK